MDCSVRKEVIGNAELWLGDCREVMASWPACRRVDSLITDPPYGIGFKYASHDDTPQGYGEWIWGVVERAEALCAPGSPVFVWQAQMNFRHFHQWFPRDWRIFVQAKNFVQMRNVTMQHAYDPVVCWWIDGESWREEKGGDFVNRDWHIANSAAAVSDTQSLAKQHPCPRQVDAMEFVIGNWVKPRGIVLDPFMGSGTTGVAAALLGRKFIGIEIEERYFNIACERIENAQRQTSLLDGYDNTTRSYEQLSVFP